MSRTFIPSARAIGVENSRETYTPPKDEYVRPGGLDFLKHPSRAGDTRTPYKGVSSAVMQSKIPAFNNQVAQQP